MNKTRHRKQKRKYINFNKAFTLIELMVSTSIFVIVMMIAMGALITTSNLAKKSYGLNFTMDNLSFAIESISRSIRMGTNYTCAPSIDLLSSPLPLDCPTGESLISFIPALAGVSSRMEYKIQSRGDGTNTIERCSIVSGSIKCVDMISSNIDIETFKFFVNGSDKLDLIQPSTYFMVKGSVIIKESKTSFAIQTIVSQRTSE